MDRRTQLGGNPFTNDGTGRGMFVSREGVTYQAAPPAPSGVDVCAAATGEVLVAALKASPDVYRRAAYPSGFRRIQCSAPFALGSTAVASVMLQSYGVLFRRDGSRWVALDMGSAMQCAKYGVTAANSLEGCAV